MKRGILGIYRRVGADHLTRYLAECDFRYSEREALGVSDADIVVNASGLCVIQETIHFLRQKLENVHVVRGHSATGRPSRPVWLARHQQALPCAWRHNA